MLISLNIKNLALIDGMEVNFHEGLNIISGETGAGKSIIINSINLALGERVDKDIIRNGAEYALIELVFQIKSPETIECIKKMDFVIDEDGILIIQRKIMTNRSLFKVGGENVSLKQCKELASLLIQIYGQHEHQTLLVKKNYLSILDEYAGEEIVDVLNDIKREYTKLNEYISKLNEIEIDEQSKNREVEFLEFEIKEIEDAALKLGEDDLIEKDYSKMLNSSKIRDSINLAYEYLSDNSGITDSLSKVIKELNYANRFDEVIDSFLSQAMELESLVNDLNHDISSYINDLEFDEEEFAQCEMRLNLINRLKSKYGKTIQEIIDYQVKQNERLKVLSDLDEYREELNNKIELTKKKLYKHCEDANEIRTRAKELLQTDLTNALLELNFRQIDFQIDIVRKLDIGINGFDEVDFLISTNIGEKARPISQIASGGELSRIMLGLKTIMANKGQINTFVFDEIDAGISGKTAWQVGKKLALLAKENQIICITHLPQIAAMSDYHMRIEKVSKDDITKVNIVQLDEEATINEIARLVGGDVINDAILTNARELRRQAKKLK